MLLQGEHRSCGSGDTPRQNKNTQQPGQREKKEITVDNIQIEILRKGESARYLGQKITFEDQGTEEVKNRLKAAWAAFHKYRQELTSRDYRLCHRLRFFNMVITPTMTYASGTWTLTQKHQATKRKRCPVKQKKKTKKSCLTKTADFSCE